jgi:hypothetical protein
MNLDEAISFADELQMLCAAEKIVFRLSNQAEIAG